MHTAEARPASPESTRVLIAVEEHPLHDSLCALLDAEPRLELAGSAPDAERAIAQARALQPHVALLDVRLPGGGGARTLSEIAEVSPQTRVVALSADEDRAHVLELLRAGAIGHVVKTDPPAEIVDAIHRAARGRASLSAGVVAELVQGLSPDGAERDRAARRAVLSHLVSAEEEERRRIAADIHDDSIQVMTAAGMRLQILRRELSEPAQLERLAELERTVQL